MSDEKQKNECIDICIDKIASLSLQLAEKDAENKRLIVLLAEIIDTLERKGNGCFDRTIRVLRSEIWKGVK